MPGKFPEDFYPVIGMSVLSCVEYYDRTHGPGTWDAADVARRVGAVKEGHYQELTAAGIAAMQGVQAMVRELESLGVRFGIASSGAQCSLCMYCCRPQLGMCTVRGFLSSLAVKPLAGYHSSCSCGCVRCLLDLIASFIILSV